MKYLRAFLVCNSDLETTGRVLDLHLSIWLCQIVSHTWLNRVSIVICYDRLSTTFCLRGLYIFENCILMWTAKRYSICLILMLSKRKHFVVHTSKRVIWWNVSQWTLKRSHSVRNVVGMYVVRDGQCPKCMLLEPCS